MPPVFREDPYASHQFEVVITGISDDGTAVKGSFSECTGLDVSMDPIEYRNGSEDFTPRKIPGLKKFPNIVLKRGIIGVATRLAPRRTLTWTKRERSRGSHIWAGSACGRDEVWFSKHCGRLLGHPGQISRYGDNHRPSLSGWSRVVAYVAALPRHAACPDGGQR